MSLGTSFYEIKPELNITPLVDVMLVLLAILMVTAPVLEYEEKINLPSGSKSIALSNLAKINIMIDNKQIITYKKKKYSFLSFADSFNLISKNIDKNTPVHIRADKNLKYADVIFILKTIKEVGFLKVSLVTDG